MTGLVALTELLLGVVVGLVIVGCAMVVIVRSVLASPSLVKTRFAVLVNSGAEDAGFQAVLASFLQRHGCQIEDLRLPLLRYESAGQVFEQHPGVDYMIELTMEHESSERLSSMPNVGTNDPLTLDVLPIAVNMPTVEYTVQVRIRGRQGEFHRQTLYPFRWSMQDGNNAAEEVGEEIIAALIGDVASPIGKTALAHT